MISSEFFVSKRPIAWTAMISVLVWGVYAYTMMPQRQDPIIPVVTGVVITPYPGAEAEKVEQEVTRKIERKVAELGGVKSLYSDSYYPEEEFWRLYNQPAYGALKGRYDPQRRFRNLYEKCVLKR